MKNKNNWIGSKGSKKLTFQRKRPKTAVNLRLKDVKDNNEYATFKIQHLWGCVGVLWMWQTSLNAPLILKGEHMVRKNICFCTHSAVFKDVLFNSTKNNRTEEQEWGRPAGLHRKYETADQRHISTQMELNFNFQNCFKMLNVRLSNPLYEIEYFFCLWSLTVSNIRNKQIFFAIIDICPTFLGIKTLTLFKV